MTTPPRSPALFAGRYALFDQIASGGMATVHIGRLIGPVGFARTVAIKRLHPHLATDPEFVTMFLDEARLAARIQHPNVVATLDVIAAEGELFLVMEYVPGVPLLKLMRVEGQHRPLPAPAVVNILAAALDGLHAAHEAKNEDGEPLGLVHRDISPQNILVSVDGVSRVLDFGVAKAEGQAHMTRQGEVKGKIAYMAPEQLTGQGVDRRTDLFAAAIVLWEALAGRRLFQGRTEPELLHNILHAPIEPPGRFAPRVPAALDQVVLRALERSPGARYASAKEMAMALTEAVPLVSAHEVARLVTDCAGPLLAERAALVKEIEKLSAGKADAAGAMSLASGGLPSTASLGISSGRFSSSHPPPSARPPSSRPLPPSAAPFTPHPGTPAPVTLGSSVPPPPGPGPLHVPPASPLAASSSLPGTLPSAVGPQRPRGAGLALGGLALLALSAGVALLLSRRGDRAPGSLAAAGSAPASLPSTPGAARPPSCPAGMAPIPGGNFYMGLDAEYALPFEKPQHSVALAPYCMDVTEVTVEAYRACSDRGDCPRAAETVSWPRITPREKKVYGPLCNIDDPGRDRHPINCVDWEMADTFCKKSGKRLPTSAEWELAVRGPDGRVYPWGDEKPSANLLNACGKECVKWGADHGEVLTPMHDEDDGFAVTAPVGSFPKGRSRYGLDDVIGNVMEWVEDWDGPYTKEAQRDPHGPAAGSERVVRGGAWNAGDAAWVRPSFRFHFAPEGRSHGIGFRCARGLP